jgi:hypothetical protein
LVIESELAKQRQAEGGKTKVPVNLPEAGDARDKAAKQIGM